jgi:FlaA1/EpsC-like NDP-sugar epimerase
MRDLNAASEAAALLARPEIVVDLAPVHERMAGRTVLVSGAAGSIGGELSRRIADCKPACLVLLDREETGLHRVERDLRERQSGLELVPVLLDVQDRPALHRLFGRRCPAFVFHAAAYKHVPMLETHPAAGVLNNIGGTLRLAEAARRAGTERFVFISTDKAIRPRSVMGATKRAGEIALQALAAEGGATRFITVRFGNVLDSRGNVVEQFRRQIARGEPLTVTHPEMTRYFMTASEAAGLVLHASLLGDTGEVFLLDVGPPQRIMDLARRMVSLARRGAGRRIDIVVGEPRPGEKIQEDYHAPGLELRPTGCPHVLQATLPAVEPRAVRTMLRALLGAARGGSPESTVQALAELVPDYAPSPGRP